MRCSLFGASLALCLAASAAKAQDVFVIDDQQTTTNGGNTVLDGDTLIVTDTGSIVVTGGVARAMEGTGNAITLDNRGRLVTDGGIGSHAQNIEGDFASIANSGEISTEGSTSPAQRLRGDFGTVINSGTITIRGFGSDGQTVRGDGGMVINTGTITTLGRGATGQESIGDLKVINSGIIVTRGPASFGQSNTNGQIINTGSIILYGADSTGQSLGGRDGTLTNSGRVVSVNGRAIFFDDRRSGHTLNLLAPGFIGGEIVFDTDTGTPTALNVTTGPSHSILWTLEGDKVGGAPNFAGPVPWFYDAATQIVATFDPTLLASETNALGDLTSLLSQVGLGALDRSGPDLAIGGNSPLAYQQADDSRSDSVQATDRALQADAVTHRMGRVWATGLGGQMNHDGGDSTLDSTIEHIGFAAGYRWQHSTEMTLNAMGGYVSGKAKADAPWAQSFDHDVDTVFAGLAGEKDLGRGSIQFGLTAGYQWVDHNRFVNDNLAPLGESWVTANYGGFFVSPELAVFKDIAMANGVTLTPNAGLRYAAQWLDGYSETGAVNPAANAVVAARFVGVLEARAELEASRVHDFGILSGRIGYVGRWNGGSDAAAITLNGSTQEVASGYHALNAVTVGATLRSDFGETGFFELDTSYLYGDTAHGFGGWLTVGRAF